MSEQAHNHTIYGVILRHAVTVLIVTFTLGGWVAKIQIDLTAERKRGDKLELQIEDLKELRIRHDIEAKAITDLWQRVKALEKKP